MPAPTLWTSSDAKAYLQVPSAADHKYSRGVSCVVAGSDAYPGAAILATDACLHTGTGMARYIGPETPRMLVLQRSPETVVNLGRVDAALIGSGIPKGPIDHVLCPLQRAAVQAIAHDRVPVVIDAGALLWTEMFTGPKLITPHAAELAQLLSIPVDAVNQSPEASARLAAERFGCVVLLKGSRSWICAENEASIVVEGANPWLATAGTGDVLAGILVSLLTTNNDSIVDARSLMEMAASGALLHAKAAELAKGPFTVRQLIHAIPEAFRRVRDC